MSSDTISTWVHRHWGDQYKTLSEVSELVGRPPRSIKRWIARGLVPGAKQYAMMGSAYVWLYDEEDVERIWAYSRGARSGPRTGRQPT